MCMCASARARVCGRTCVLNLKYVCMGVCMLKKPERSGGEAGGKGGWGVSEMEYISETEVNKDFVYVFILI